MADNTLIYKIDIQGTDQQSKELGQLTAELDKVKRSLNQLKAIEKEQGALTAQQSQERARLQTQLVGTRNAYNDLQATILKQNDALRKNSGFVAGVRKGVQQWASSMIGITAAIYGVTRVLGDAAKVITEFQQNNAKLASVLGKTRSEIKALTEDAKRLGASTAFTASQVSELQTEFAKLGFSQSEILNATEATLSLAAATGTDLAEAASVAGSTVRGFGLSTLETKRVVDVMAKSFSSSALDMQKFSVAMAAVAPVAKNSGISLERTTAMLGKLVDAGVDASTAGTALRNILLENAQAGRTLEEGFNLILDSTNKNATAMELYGTRGATVATILAETITQTDELTKSLESAGGAAEKMANEQLDTLSGSLTKLSSAWEGFILSLEDGESQLGQFFKQLFDNITGILGWISQTDEATEAMNKYNKTLQSTRQEAELMIKTAQTEIKQAQFFEKTYENRVNALIRESNAGKISNKELNKRMKALVAEKEQNERLIEVNTKYIDLLYENGFNINQLAEAESNLNEKKIEDIEATNAQVEARKGLIESLEAEKKILSEKIVKAESIDEIVKLEKELEKVELRLKYLTSLTEKDNVIEFTVDLKTEDGLNVLDAYRDKMQEVSDEVAKAAEEISSSTAEEVDNSFYDLLLKQKEAAEKTKQEWEEAYKSIAMSAVDAAAAIGRDFFDQQIKDAQKQADEEKRITEERYKNGEITATEYNASLRQIATAQREKEKEAAISQAYIDGASAALKALVVYGPTPAAAAGAAIAALQTASTIAIIENQKFADGGVFDGKSHAEGGIKGTLNGKRVEFEGDEMWIANKRAKRSKERIAAVGTPEEIFSGLNGRYGGRNWRRGALITDAMNVDLTKGGSTMERMIQNELNLNPLIREFKETRRQSAYQHRESLNTIKMKSNGYY